MDKPLINYSIKNKALTHTCMLHAHVISFTTFFCFLFSYNAVSMIFMLYVTEASAMLLINLCYLMLFNVVNINSLFRNGL